MSNPRSKLAAPTMFVGGFMLLLGGFYKDTPGGIIGITLGAGLVVLGGYLGVTACRANESSGSTAALLFKLSLGHDVQKPGAAVAYTV
jgi:hypothetical protein